LQLTLMIFALFLCRKFHISSLLNTTNYGNHF